ncbi:MFS transporter [Marinactinospora thermotolerans]|uniref:Predicted arabinose efflux permease, MFS family n=1 Tax=Marinactinospora thermotolerans DSM 45154 TaxID=1122192 RepID=A0A1T4M0V7_9ACTN|nr:MFS transporter [Marinactinospora thermotolerans]SJZ60541.1 Predicted arabinose efflux permease, MFS family [Marinactinospora thermotolerans DSM 45154]
MSPLAALRRMREIAGTPLLAASFLARLPVSMSLIGVLTLVTTQSGSVAAGGLVSGALALGEMVGGPVIARLADRRGQRPVVLTASLVDAALIGVLVTAVFAGASTPTLAVLAILAGLAMPQIGPLARARWISIAGRSPHDRERSVAAALSVDGVLDETGFVVGPALVGLLALAADPAMSVLGAAVLMGVFGSVFALHPTALPGAPPQSDGGRVGGLGLFVLALPMACQGMFFGSTSTGVTAYSQQIGHGDLSGLLYAVMGVSSAAAGLLMASVPARVALTLRLRAASLGLGLFSLLLFVAPDLWTLLAAMFLLGSAIGPHVVTIFALVERSAPATRLAQAMTIMLSALILGQSLGSAVAGDLAERYGHHGAFALTTGAAFAAFAVAVLVVRSRWYIAGDRSPAPADA